jgi:H+/Cl- antiporter ClcA
VGCGLTTYLVDVVDPAWFHDSEYKQLLVLGGITAPLAALLQAPALGALLMHELAKPPK